MVGSTKTPFYVSAASSGCLPLAGLFDVWENAAGKRLYSYALLTQGTVGKELSWLHERMPVVLDAHGMDAWLSAAPLSEVPHNPLEDATSGCTAASGGGSMFVWHAVDPKMSSLSYKGEDASAPMKAPITSFFRTGAGGASGSSGAGSATAASPSATAVPVPPSGTSAVESGDDADVVIVDVGRPQGSPLSTSPGAFRCRCACSRGQCGEDYCQAFYLPLPFFCGAHCVVVVHAGRKPKQVSMAGFLRKDLHPPVGGKGKRDIAAFFEKAGGTRAPGATNPEAAAALTAAATAAEVVDLTEADDRLDDGAVDVSATGIAALRKKVKQ